MKMKIYNRIVMNITTGEILEEESYQYDGPVALCKGGGGGTTTSVDYVYNDRMATISEKNQKYADEMYNMFKYGVTYNPESASGEKYKTGKMMDNPEWDDWNKKNEQYKKYMRSGGGNGDWQSPGYGLPRVDSPGPEPSKQIEEMANRTNGEVEGYDPNTPTEMSLMQDKIQAESDLLPGVVKSKQQQMSAFGAMYEDAMSVDVDKRVAEARTGVMQDFSKVEEQTKRSMSRMGVDPTSGAAAESFKTGGLQKSMALAGVSTAARRQAENESFEKKRAVVGIGV